MSPSSIFESPKGRKIREVNQHLLTQFHPAVKNVAFAGQNLARAYETECRSFHAYIGALFTLAQSGDAAADKRARKHAEHLRKSAQILQKVYSEHTRWIEYFTKLSVITNQNFESEKDRLKNAFNSYTKKEKNLLKTLSKTKHTRFDMEDFYDEELQAAVEQQTQRYRFFADRHDELLRRSRECAKTTIRVIDSDFFAVIAATAPASFDASRSECDFRTAGDDDDGQRAAYAAADGAERSRRHSLELATTEKLIEEWKRQATLDQRHLDELYAHAEAEQRQLERKKSSTNSNSPHPDDPRGDGDGDNDVFVDAGGSECAPNSTENLASAAAAAGGGDAMTTTDALRLRKLARERASSEKFLRAKANKYKTSTIVDDGNRRTSRVEVDFVDDDDEGSGGDADAIRARSQSAPHYPLQQRRARNAEEEEGEKQSEKGGNECLNKANEVGSAADESALSECAAKFLRKRALSVRDEIKGTNADLPPRHNTYEEKLRLLADARAKTHSSSSIYQPTPIVALLRHQKELDASAGAPDYEQSASGESRQQQRNLPTPKSSAASSSAKNSASDNDANKGERAYEGEQDKLADSNIYHQFRRTQLEQRQQQRQHKDADDVDSRSAHEKLAGEADGRPERLEWNGNLRKSETPRSQKKSSNSSPPSSPVSQPPIFAVSDYGRLLECVAPYEARGDNQLTLDVGDSILLVKSGMRGWVLGRTEDGMRQGWFPAKFLRLL